MPAGFIGDLGGAVKLPGLSSGLPGGTDEFPQHPFQVRLYFHIIENMKLESAVGKLGALAHGSRLSIFRLLVRKGPDGLCAGDIATRLKIPAPTLSFHLKELSRAGLIRARQDGRFLYYAPDFKVMNDLLGYLTEHCCEGVPCEIACAPQGKEAAA